MINRPSEQEAAATFARECTDHAAVILWCADRVRSVDDDTAVQDAADYLHSLSTRAQVGTGPITDRPAVIRWCAQQIHSMGGDANVERAAEYLDDLATEAGESGKPQPEFCAHCGGPIRRVTGTLAAWWVHDPDGHTACNPDHAARSHRAMPSAKEQQDWTQS